MKVAVLALMATMGGAFVAPAPRAKVSGGIVGDQASAITRPTSRSETSAVAPLNIAGFSLSSITDIFTRKSACCGSLVSMVACFVGWSCSQTTRFAAVV